MRKIPVEDIYDFLGFLDGTPRTLSQIARLMGRSPGFVERRVQAYRARKKPAGDPQLRQKLIRSGKRGPYAVAFYI